MAVAVKQTAFTRASARTRATRVVCQAQPAPLQKIALTAASVVISAGLAISPAFAANGVKIANIKDGSTVSSPVRVEFDVSGLTVKPAAEGLQPGTGHFHLLLDLPSIPEGEAIPFDDVHKHYGKGQLADDVALAPGKHTLTLQFANAVHQSYGPEFSQTITVNVQP
mmetsp:Transcript_8743/g.18642  ORF Transcript_8743/g.18642 Transcript_8743/m.18642 type:complete len:167 (+) Transcript_8743:1900-2400(+)